MKFPRRWSLLGLSVVVALSASAPAEAQAEAPSGNGPHSDVDRATARALGQEGEAALDAKDYTMAEDRFRRADSLFHAPTLALGLARAQAGLGKYVTAQETYQRIVREGVPPGAPAPFVRAVESAKSEGANVANKVASVVLQVTGPEAPKVTVDEVPVPSAALGVRRPIDPGTHALSVSADGWEPSQTTFTVADGASITVPIALNRPLATPATEAAALPAVSAPLTSAPPAALPPGADADADAARTRRTVGYVALAGGGALLAAGVVFGVLAIAKHGKLEDDGCQDGKCPMGSAKAQSDLDSFHTFGTLSTLGFAIGGVAAVTGLVLVLTAPRDGSSAAFVSPYVDTAASGAGGTVGAYGRF